MGKTLLEIVDLSLVYEVGKSRYLKALDDIYLRVHESEIVALVGESGCGKSTLGYTIMRILPRNAKIIKGSIYFENKDLLKLSEKDMKGIRGAKISMIFQDPSSTLNPVMRVGEHVVELLMTHRRIDREEAWNITFQLFEKLGIPKERAYDYPHQLSGGMKQRVCIALAIALNPKIVIADEPTTALDVITQDQILELFKQLRQTYNTSFIFITHDLSIVADLADRVAIMYGGEIVEEGDVESIFYEPLHPYTKLLLNCVPSIDARKKKLETISGELLDLTSPIPGCKFHNRCRYCTDICIKARPNMIKYGENHYVKCWLYSRR